MERMGHTSPAVALRYQHVMADRQAQLASALDDLARAATTPAKDTARACKGTQRGRGVTPMPADGLPGGCWSG